MSRVTIAPLSVQASSRSSGDGKRATPSCLTRRSVGLPSESRARYSQAPVEPDATKYTKSFVDLSQPSRILSSADNVIGRRERAPSDTRMIPMCRGVDGASSVALTNTMLSRFGIQRSGRAYSVDGRIAAGVSPLTGGAVGVSHPQRLATRAMRYGPLLSARNDIMSHDRLRSKGPASVRLT